MAEKNNHHIMAFDVSVLYAGSNFKFWMYCYYFRGNL